MKHRYILIIFIVNIIVSCKKETTQWIESKHSINISGHIGPSLKFNDKYYCIFRNDNDSLSTQYSSTFYIIDESGKPESKIKLPNEFQTWYYDLYLKKDTIFITEYNNNETCFFDFESKRFKKTKKASDLFYQDADFEIYSLDFGEWGSKIWFKDLKTNLQYEMHGHAPIVNKINNIYYVTTENTVYKIKDPKKLLKSEKYYNLEESSRDKLHYSEGNFSTLGTNVLLQLNHDYFGDSNTVLISSYVSNDSLLHVYKDSISTKIGYIKNKKIIPTYEFPKGLKLLQFYYDWRMPTYSNQQTIPFITDNEQEFVFLEINNGKIETKIFLIKNQ